MASRCCPNSPESATSVRDRRLQNSKTTHPVAHAQRLQQIPPLRTPGRHSFGRNPAYKPERKRRDGRLCAPPLRLTLGLVSRRSHRTGHAPAANITAEFRIDLPLQVRYKWPLRVERAPAPGLSATAASPYTRLLAIRPCFRGCYPCGCGMLVVEGERETC
jgi:hypothetical protein